MHIINGARYEPQQKVPIKKYLHKSPCYYLLERLGSGEQVLVSTDVKLEQKRFYESIIIFCTQLSALVFGDPRYRYQESYS